MFRLHGDSTDSNTHIQVESGEQKGLLVDITAMAYTKKKK